MVMIFIFTEAFASKTAMPKTKSMPTKPKSASDAPTENLLKFEGRRGIRIKQNISIFSPYGST